jgi:hypothetical protein
MKNRPWGTRTTITAAIWMASTRGAWLISEEMVSRIPNKLARSTNLAVTTASPRCPMTTRTAPMAKRMMLMKV